MPEEEKEKPAPSFTKLLRGGPSLSPESRPPSRLTELPKKEEKRKRPIILPFQRKEGGEEGLFSITYREWAFLLGALLLLFGGMGLIRMFSPKDTMTPSLAPFGDAEPGSELTPGLEEGTRPPGGGDEEVISPLTARDTTRLVTPPSGMFEKKEKPKSVADSLKESLWGGLKEAEKRTPPRPSLGGLGPSLGAALAGVNAGPPSQGMRWMSPEELSARLRSIPTTSPGGREGVRLGYSGGQRIPGLGGGRRSLGGSSADRYGRMREAYQGPQASERMAAQAGAPFGEARAGGESPGGPGGASVGGETPRSDPGKSELGSYNIQRPPWAMEEWQLAHWWERAWKDALAKGLGEGVGGVAKGVGGAFGESFSNFVKCGTWDSSGCEPPPPPNLRHAWVMRTCPSAVPGGYQVAELVLDYAGVPQQPGASPKGKVNVVSRGEITEVTAGGQGKQKTTKPDTQTRACLKGAEPVLLSEDDLYAIRSTGKTKDELLASAGVTAPPSAEPTSPTAPEEGGAIRPGSAADIQGEEPLPTEKGKAPTLDDEATVLDSPE